MPTKKKDPTKRIRKAPKSGEEPRTIAVCSRLDSAEAAKLDTLRGKMQRGVYLRMLINGVTPQLMPEINMQAYNTLLNISNRLDAIGSRRGVFSDAQIAEVRKLISNLRLELLNVKLESKNQ